MVHPSSYVHPKAIIGKDAIVGPFCTIMSDCFIGENTKIGQNVTIENDVIIGKNVVLENNISLCRGTVIEDNVYVGSSVVFSELLNPRITNHQKKLQHILVKYSARISPNVTVFQGNSIGKYAFIGAGAVITKPVMDYALIAGNPSKQVGWISEMGFRLIFKEEKALCPFSNEHYQIYGKTIQKITNL